jgi:RNA polymerase sigma-70 factor (ECF subfamily)
MSPEPVMPTDSAPDARALVAAMAGGDKWALGRLITLYGRGLTIYCARALVRSHDAEDAVQEVFVKAWTAAASYDPGKGAVSTWLYRIALRHCTDRNRRSGFRQFLGLESAPEPMDDAPDALRDLAAREDVVRVRTAIAALPDRQRQALLLKVVAEMSNPEIASTMNCAVGAVEQLLVRARSTLRARTDVDLTLE